MKASWYGLEEGESYEVVGLGCDCEGGVSLQQTGTSGACLPHPAKAPRTLFTTSNSLLFRVYKSLKNIDDH